MKRMDGLQLIHFVKQEQPAVRAYLIDRGRAPSGPSCALPAYVAGRIAYPFAVGELAARLCAERPAGEGEEPEGRPVEEGRMQ